MNIKWYANVSRLGDELLVRGFDDNDQEVMTKVPYSPTLYVEHPKDYGFKNVYGKNLKPIQFQTMSESNDFANQHKDSNLKIYGSPFYAGQFCLENFSNTSEIWKKQALRVFNIDIEVTSSEGFPVPEEANFPITAICIHDSKSDRFVTFGFSENLGHDWKPENSELPSELLSKVLYIDCKDEQDLMRKFLDFWKKFPPNIVTGWNVDSFDLPYIFNRMTRIGMNPKNLSPWNFAKIRSYKNQQGYDSLAVDIMGVDVIDYLERYRKSNVQDSYRLDNIASIELGENKLDYSEVSGLHNLYFTNYQKFIDYNIQDVNLVNRLDKKLGLIDVQIMIAYSACVNFSDVGGTVRTWDALISKELWLENKVSHFHISPPGGDVKIPGGYVKDPQVGKHGWCLSFDVNSLYPHLIMQFNISPETINEEFKLWPFESQEVRVSRLLKNDALGNVPANHSISAAGYAFNNEFEGIIPRIMRRFYQERKDVKKKMISLKQEGKNADIENIKQFALKILLNSGYGAFINRYYRWFDSRLGEAITLSGQMMIQTSEKSINNFMNKVMKTKDVDYIIAIDTDSNYVNVQPLVDKFFSNKTREEIVDILDNIAEEQLQKAIDDGFDSASKYLNCRAQEMVMKRESIASSAFWTAKKRYAMAVWDLEGVRYKETPKIKIQGLEAIRSSTPPSCRQPLLDIIKTTLLSDEKSVQEYIVSFKKKYMDLPFEEIAFPRSMNNIKKCDTGGSTFASGTPPQVRGAIQFNRLIISKGLEKDWELMKDGEKGKFIYLRQPNNVGTDVISFTTTLPQEFDCEKYIDRETMFKKSVVEPVKGILEPIGWSAEKQMTLASFFG